MPKEQNYLLPETVRAGILRYLYARPYQEVAQGVAALLNLEAAPEPESDEKKDGEG